MLERVAKPTPYIRMFLYPHSNQAGNQAAITKLEVDHRPTTCRKSESEGHGRGIKSVKNLFRPLSTAGVILHLVREQILALFRG